MSKNNMSLFFIICLLGTVSIAQCNLWCIPELSVSQQSALNFLDYACAKVDCQAIQPAGSCFEPSTAIAHASYALDVYFVQTGRCPKNFGRLITSDPSFGKCRYPSRPGL